HRYGLLYGGKKAFVFDRHGSPSRHATQGIGRRLANACYYYSTTVYEWKKDGDEYGWEEIACECRYLPFFLGDDSGRVTVGVRGAELDIPREFQGEFCDYFFSPKKRTPDNVRNFLARRSVSTRGKIKVEEYCIKPKNPLFIVGTLAESSDPEGVKPS